MPISDDATYQSAWNEAMRRVIVRDTALLGYVGAVGTLLFQSQQKAELALAVPFVTFVLGCAIAHHDFMIASLNSYLRGFQSKEPGTQLWHSSRLRGSLIIGFLLYTVPAIAIFVVYSCIAHDIARAIPLSAPIHRLLPWAKLVSILGVGALLSGRIRHFFALPIRFQRPLQIGK
jgi:hypothetical protein